MTEINKISDSQIHVIDKNIPYSDYVAIDLSAGNSELESVKLNDPDDFGRYIINYLSKHKSAVAYGGYNEHRNLYRTSSIFNSNDAEDRNIHIGIDLWTSAGTSVLAALDGTIHSFSNNIGKGNYGPTIILKHEINDTNLYTLYGHLSLDSIDNLTVGASIRQGQIIAALGTPDVNGGYPPHLHFQLIRQIGPYSGDYPGVCSRSDQTYYLENCPDPNLLLKIK